MVSAILAGREPLLESRESEMALGNRICSINQMNELPTVRSACNRMRCEAAATALDCGSISNSKSATKFTRPEREIP